MGTGDRKKVEKAIASLKSDDKPVNSEILTGAPPPSGGQARKIDLEHVRIQYTTIPGRSDAKTELGKLDKVTIVKVGQREDAYKQSRRSQRQAIRSQTRYSEGTMNAMEMIERVAGGEEVEDVIGEGSFVTRKAWKKKAEGATRILRNRRDGTFRR